MKLIAIIVAGLLLTACQEPGARTAEEEVNLAETREITELFNQHTPPAEYFDDYNAEDMVWTGFLSFPPFRKSAPRDQVKAIVQRNHDLAPDRKITTVLRVADGDIVVSEREINSERRDVREVQISKFRDGKVSESRTYSVVLPRKRDPLHRTPQERANEVAALRWIRLFNGGGLDWWDDVYTPDVTWESYGSGYQSRKGEDFKALVAQAREVFPDRAFEVLSLSTDGDRVIIETRWTGTAARPFLRFKPGDRRTSRNLLFLTYRDGKIAAVTTYVAGETIEERSPSTVE
jgi:ketosteroid isomerase-like protein